MLKRLLTVYGILLVVAVIAIPFLTPRVHDEEWLRERIVQLDGKDSNCTGVQVRAPSGKSYILTAAHCKHLASNGIVIGKFDEKVTEFYKVVAEDDESDLLLLEGAGDLRGVDIASDLQPKQHVRTLTHGHHFKTYLTEGVMVDSVLVHIPVFKVDDWKQRLDCLSSMKYQLVTDPEAKEDWCVLVTMEGATTALIVPGSSGGPIFDDHGDLVGIISAQSTGFGYFVQIEDIKRFLRDY